MTDMICSIDLEDICEKAIVVAAHPDDEILWFSSVIGQAQQVIICYLQIDARPDWTNGRMQALARYPLLNIKSLDLKETDVFNCSDWQYPKLSSFGMDIQGSGCNQNQYEANYHQLENSLRKILHPDMHVFTHNPWGEYGHEEHVQVFRAIETLQSEIGFHIWVPNYISNRSIPLMLASRKMIDYCFTKAPSDRILAAQIRDLYRQYNCWTWYWEFNWMKEEVFMKIKPRNQRGMNLGKTFPLNFIDVGEERVKHPFIRRTDRMVEFMCRARNHFFANKKRY
jgi:LmbE family N-acetylglucosaminyl deacetylase